MKIYIETVGCKLNQFESQALLEEFGRSGFESADSIESADVVVVNTCSVTNKADVKSRLIMRKAKKLSKRVVATGCYATTDFDELSTSDFADIVVRNDLKFKIPALLNERLSFEQSLGKENGELDFPIVNEFERTRAFVKIQDGCDKFCSYCKIPHARGRSKSLSPDTTIKFVKSLVDSGYKEIILTGVNISDYHFNTTRLSSLIGMILALPGEFRIRLSSLQPDEFEPELLTHLAHPKFTSHFHLSLQSGSTGVLRRMERNYTPEYFLKLIHDIRAVSPDAGITTDIIVGFPGETEEEFNETLELAKKAAFTRVHLFAYSRRSHTKAARMKDLDGNLKRDRLKKLEDVALQAGLEFVRSHVLGKAHRILVEKEEKGIWSGYTPNYLRISTSRKLPENEFVEITPTSAEIRDSGIELWE